MGWLATIGSHVTWQPLGHELQSSVQSGLQVGRDAPAGGLHVTPPRLVPSHPSPGSMVPLPQLVSSPLASLMNASTADSSVFVCPLCVQLGPAVSAFDIDAENFVSALARQVESTGTPFEAAFAWHLALFPAFFPAAWIFFESHRFGPAALLFTMSRTLSTKASTLFSIVPESPVGAWQSAFVSALLKAEPNFTLALSRQSVLTGSPFATAFP